MKEWANLSEKNKLEYFKNFKHLYVNIYTRFSHIHNLYETITNRIKETENDGYRDFLILYILDKKLTVKDGFSFFNASGMNLNDEDIYKIMSEKLDVNFDDILTLYAYNVLNTNSLDLRPINIEIDSIMQTSKTIFEDIKTRMEIWSEVHGEEYRKENHNEYLEKLNSPLSSMFSIKLSRNEKITKALKKRISKAKASEYTASQKYQDLFLAHENHSIN